MKKIGILLITLIFWGSMASSVHSQTLYDWSFKVNETIYYWGDTLPATFDDSSFDWDTGLGEINVSSFGEGTYNFVSFFDHEFSEPINSYFNEHGADHGTPAGGQSWEIDEPQYLFGDIVSNTIAGVLDNTNAVPAGSEDDVSMALAWDFFLGAGETAMVTLSIANLEPTSGFYLEHTDPDSVESIFFSSSLEISGSHATVPEPSTLLLLGSGLASLAYIKRKVVNRKSET